MFIGGCHTLRHLMKEAQLLDRISYPLQALTMIVLLFAVITRPYWPLLSGSLLLVAVLALLVLILALVLLG